MPLGRPVDPDVYSTKRGCEASTAAAAANCHKPLTHWRVSPWTRLEIASLLLLLSAGVPSTFVGRSCRRRSSFVARTSSSDAATRFGVAAWLLATDSCCGDCCSGSKRVSTMARSDAQLAASSSVAAASAIGSSSLLVTSAAALVSLRRSASTVATVPAATAT